MTRIVLVLAASMTAGFGCGVCEAVTPESQSLCVTAGGGLGVVINGGNERYENLTCSVAQDGGVLTLSIGGTQCAINTTAPLHAQGASACDFTGISAGTYSAVVGGTATPLTLPYQADGGTPPCAGGI